MPVEIDGAHADMREDEAIDARLEVSEQGVPGAVRVYVEDVAAWSPVSRLSPAPP